MEAPRASKKPMLWIFLVSHVILLTSECQPPCLYITIKSSISRMELNASSGYPINKTPEDVLRSDGYLRSIEIDPVNDHLYFGDMLYHSINRSSLNGTQRIPILSYAIGMAEGLTIDWSSGVLYWTDSLMKLIEVADADGRYRKVLFDLEDEDEPRGITSSPQNAWLFWTDWGETARIERSTLSGKDRMVLVNKKIMWPNDLAYDHTENRLYWIDAGLDTLESCNAFGGERTLLSALKYSRKSVHPYSIAYFSQSQTAFFTDWFTNAVYSYQNSTQLLAEVYRFNGEVVKSIGQLNIHQVPDSLTARSCLTASNNCSHLCLKDSPTSHVCACPTGMTLNINQRTCRASKLEYEIFFSDSHAASVSRLGKYQNESGFSIRQLPVPINERLKFPIALDYDQDADFVYWTDYGNHKFYRMRPDGTKLQIIRNTGGKNASVGIAVAQLSDLIYFFGSNGDTLMVSRKDGTYPNTIVSKGLKSPRDIVLAEEEGYVFVSDPGQSMILRYNMDGTHLKSFERPSRRISGMAVDKIEKRLYWCDYEYYSVESSDYDFEFLRVILQKTVLVGNRFYIVANLGFILQPQGLAILGETMFWTDTKLRAIFSSNKRDGGKVTYVTGGLDHPRDLHVTDVKNPTQHRKIYEFSFSWDGDYVGCYASCPVSMALDDPVPCPDGYKETRMEQVCGNCSDPVGANTRCFCENWMTCAQRGYSYVPGCTRRIPYMVFKVRECVQAINPGYCLPMMNNLSDPTLCPESASCSSDEDCGNTRKCCPTDCGLRCQDPSARADFPCMKNNSGCSHYCYPSSAGFSCGCPTGSYLMPDQKNCSEPGEVTPCHSEPCLNNGACRNSYDNSYVCSCEESFFGKNCQIDAKLYQVVATFTRMNLEEQLAVEEVKSVFALAYEHYCNMIGVTCGYVTVPDETKRGRRESPPLNEHIVYLSFNQLSMASQAVRIFFTVLHLTGSGYPSEVMATNTAIAGLRNQAAFIESELGLKLYSISNPDATASRHRLAVSKAVAISVTLGLAVIVAAVFLWYFCYRRRQQRLANAAAPVEFRFENDMYNDLYPANELPTEVNSKGTFIVNPAYHRNDHTHEVGIRSERIGSSESDVQENELPEKLPIDYAINAESLGPTANSFTDVTSPPPYALAIRGVPARIEGRPPTQDKWEQFNDDDKQTNT